MGTLDGLPGVVLRRVHLRALVELPADGGGIEEDLRPGQGGQASRLGEPLVPADQNAEPGGPGGNALEAQIARGEMELLVVEGIVRNVHLPVAAQLGPALVEDHRSVVIDALGAPLEHRHHQGDPMGRGGLAQGHRGGPRDGLGQLEVRRILGLAEVAGAEQLRETDDLRTPAGR